MRHLAAAIFLLAATSAAEAQCPIGSFPTTNADANTVCQSPGGQTPTDTRPPNVGRNCPEGAVAGFDQWGNRSCSTLAEGGPLPVEGGGTVKKPKRKQFEISRKCPQCK